MSYATVRTVQRWITLSFLGGGDSIEWKYLLFHHWIKFNIAFYILMQDIRSDVWFKSVPFVCRGKYFKYWFLFTRGDFLFEFICRMNWPSECIILRHVTRSVEWSGLMEPIQDIMNRSSIVAVHRDGGSVKANVVTSTLARLYVFMFCEETSSVL